MSTQKNIRAYLNGTDISTTMTGYRRGNRWGGESIDPGDALYFEANTAGSTIQLTAPGGTVPAVALEISTNYKDWAKYTIGDTITLRSEGDRVYMRNMSETDTQFGQGLSGNYYQFKMTGSIACGGDINYLLNKNSTSNVSGFCYSYLFNGCTSLTSAPSLPATTLAGYCYYHMFSGCTGLTKAPSLPATILAIDCYSNMFSGCTGLTNTPVLPATTLANYCYDFMFEGCKNLVTLPALPATTLARDCYRYMFGYCSKIKLSTTKTGDYQTAYRIPTSGTGATAEDALYRMFYGTGGTFTDAPEINTTYYTSNTVVQ